LSSSSFNALFCLSACGEKPFKALWVKCGWNAGEMWVWLWLETKVEQKVKWLEVGERTKGKTKRAVWFLVTRWL